MGTSTIWFAVFIILIVLLFISLRVTIRKLNQKISKNTPEISLLTEEISSGEPEIPKASVTPAELGAQFIKWLQTDPPPLTLNTVPADRLTAEFVYLQAFIFDLAAYLKLGDSYEKKVILDVFWDYITGAGVYTETFQLRMLRYTDAIKQTNPLNLSQALGTAFADHCGAPGDPEVTNIGEKIVSHIVNRLNSLFDHVTIDLDGDDLSAFELPTM